MTDANLASARVVVPLVIDLVHPTSVVDVGCGRGLWLQAFSERGVSDIRGIDGAWVEKETLVIPPERFLVKDLERPFDAGKSADLAVCLEMAEHVPAASAPGLVESLTKIAPVILFSAAIPLQGGVHHVNEQWPGYWAELFKKHDYVPVDCIRRKIWDDTRVNFFYAQNVFLYVRKDSLSRYSKLAQEAERGEGKALALVHPEMYARATERYRMLLPFLKLFPKGIKRFVRGILASRGRANP